MTDTYLKRTGNRMKSTWSSIAFIVESILLLVFLAGSLAVLTQVFSAALNHSVESRTLDAATIAATSIAEHFAANPDDVAEETVLGDLRIVCKVSDEPRAGGVMRYADIAVYDIGGKTGGPIYTIATSRYESEDAR
ncbi:MAG TPA: hypothetical protein DCP91_10520 [Eggerthellaceae bacterium]|nr:hypothetical protein [Eggerthellaceae bacterium]